MFQFDSLEINTAAGGGELLTFIDRKSYYLQRLGAGLSQVIVLLINLVLKRPPYLFIDEPELNLHPALQTEFVKSLYSRVGRGLIFATHNIGLARDTADSIYTVSKKPKEPSMLIAGVKGARLSEILGEMSFSALRELGFEKVLLVEGPTEVKVFQAFLDVLSLEPRRILIVPLGGGGMISGARKDELAELVRITDDARMIYAVIDSEGTSAGSPPKAQHTDFARVCQQLSITCKILDRRATENYFTDRAIKAVFGSTFNALGEFGSLDSVPQRWHKKENWKIAAKMTKGELNNTDLGLFLQSTLP